MRTILLGSVALVSLFACASSSDDAAETAPQDLSAGVVLGDNQAITDAQLFALAPVGDGKATAAIVFPSSGEPNIRGQIVAGGKVTVVYALNRLSQCRATHDGFQIWDTRLGGEFSNGTKIGEERGAEQGSLRAFDGGHNAHSVPVTFDVPLGAESFSIYAHNTSPAGPSSPCDAYDSKSSANYHFAVGLTASSTSSVDALVDVGDGKTTAAIIFDVGFDPIVKGNLVQGGRVIVAYAPDRLKSCRAGHDAWPYWTTQIGGQFSDGTKVGESIGGTVFLDYNRMPGHVVHFVSIPGQQGADTAPVTTSFDVPPAATDLELYAHNWNPGGPTSPCSAYDSNNGQNFRFKVASR